jgi:ATP-dependent DNA helicase RecG
VDNLIDILSKIKAPLLFLSKDSYRRLSMVKGLESSMFGLIHKLKSAYIPDKYNESFTQIINNFASGLEQTFEGFDSSPPDRQKEKLATALSLFEIVHQLQDKIEHEPPQDANNLVKTNHRVDYDRCFEMLSCPVQYVKGVGPKIKQLLSRKNIETVEDLLYFLPRKYEDRRSVRPISSLVVGRKETVMGRIIGSRIEHYRKKRIFEVTIDDGSSLLTAKWFHGNFSYLKQTFKRDNSLIVTGEVRGGYYGYREMIHPDFEVLTAHDNDLLHFKRIVPVYSETAGLHQKYIRKIMMQAVDEFSPYTASPIPDAVCRRHNLIDMPTAIKNVHFPGSDDSVDLYDRCVSDSHKRIIFDEFFFFELGMALKKRGYVVEPGIAFKTEGVLVKSLLDTLPFELTGAQKRVIAEIDEDMAQPHPMNRLLQGDVGSGKTIVSMVAMIRACENGYQSAMMAPTEILAEQHYANIEKWVDDLGLTAVLLTGSTGARHRKEILKEIEKGTVSVVVGTHALIQEAVSFHRLGLVVIDEQHRFGVMQRAKLRDKGMTPDVLVMTATPIPRTLAMTVYGDLDLSVIDELPPGKKPIMTKVFYEDRRDEVYDIIRKELRKNNQVFIVYPLVEESEVLDLKDATTMARHLQEDVFPEFSVGLVHGKMKSSEKAGIMKDFHQGILRILVSTTVIEVGIDVPTASLMVVEHAERFGLSQLHQLRGRVGRSDVPSKCVLVAGKGGTDDARKRLRIMEQTDDGFRIAEEDLVIRGPGEFMGTRQSGLPDFRVANILRDARVLNDARKEAFHLVRDDPSLEQEGHRPLKKVLLRRWAGRLELAKTG